MSKGSVEEGYKEWLETGKQQYIGKVENIIKGYNSKFDIQEVTFFENDKVLYSGSYNSFIKTSIENIYLYNEMKRILNSNCIKCLNHNNRKLFLFI